MPRIRCHYLDCIFLDDGFCGAAAIEVDPDMGCMTYSRAADLDAADEWDEDAALDTEEWDELDEEDDEMWIDDEDEF